MPRILAASCDQTGKVTIDGKVVTNAQVLSEGTKASTGVALLDGSDVTYVTSSAQDLKATIEAIDAMLQKIILIVTTLDAGTLSPGAAAANIALLTTLQTQFALKKDMLK